jgi:hypothetical protein
MPRKILFLIFLLSVFRAEASFDPDQNCILAHSAILNLQFDDAQAILLREKIIHPKNHLVLVLENYIAFIKAMLSEDPNELTKMEKLFKSSVSLLENSDNTAPYRRPALAQLYLQTAYIQSRSGNNITTALAIGKAYRLLAENKKQFPGYKAGNPQSGLLHVLIGSIPPEYKWVPRLFQMEGSVVKGESEIMSVIEDKSGDKLIAIMAPECMMMLAFIAIQIDDEKSLQNQILQLFENHSMEMVVRQSPLLTYSHAMLLMKLGKNNDAIEVLTNRIISEGQYPFHTPDYVLGTARLNKLDKNANLDFLRFTSGFKGKNLIKSAYQRLAWYYLLQGEKINYSFYMKRVISHGALNTESDKKAMQDAESGQQPATTLLRARLLFDGGYYSQALDQLSEFQPLSADILPEHRLEFYYRKARILHQMDKLDEALQYYYIVLKQGATSPYYFAANSALNMGNIWASRGITEKARAYYKQCLSLEYTEYRDGISQEARARLNRLNAKK